MLYSNHRSQCSILGGYELADRPRTAGEKKPDTQDIADMADEFASDNPQFSTDIANDLYMVRASFDEYEGPMVTDRYVRLGLVLDGHGTFHNRTNLGSFDCRFEPNSIFATIPGMHGETKSSPMSLLGFFIDVARFNSFQNIDEMEDLSSSVFNDATIRSVMLAIWQSSHCSNSSSLFVREGIELLLNRMEEVVYGIQTETSIKHANEQRMIRVKSFVSENLDEQITVEDMARTAGLSYHQFFAVCRQMTGMTPFTFLTYCRLQRAKHLIKSGASILEAALEVNYSNPSKFASAFKRLYGMTPTQWKMSDNKNLYNSKQQTSDSISRLPL